MATGRVHPAELDAAIAHYNASFRQRYRLPPTSSRQLARLPGFNEAFGELDTVRAGGVADPGCAVIARSVLATTPRFAIGMLDAAGQLHVLVPRSLEDVAYRDHHLILVNPIGGRDNWAIVSRFVRRAADNVRRAELAGLASEERPDEAANARLMQEALAEGRSSGQLPPDEAFSAARAAEVSYIYDVPIETLRAWKSRHRRQLAASRPGRPRKPLRRRPSP